MQTLAAAPEWGTSPTQGDSMPAPILAEVHFDAFLLGVVWAAFAVLNFWIWSKSKAAGNLLMLLGAGWQALGGILGFFEVNLLGWQNIFWSGLIGAALITLGFYFSVKPMVEAQLAALQAKVKHIGHKDAGAGGPPPPAK
jgi:hypothetical protein